MKLLRFKQAKRATLVLFCLCIALTVFSQLPISAVQNQVNNELQTSANLPDKLGFQMVYENKSAAMYTDVKGEFKGTFALRNKVDGTVWYSSPPDYSSDTISFNTNELLSLLNLTYYDKDENILFHVITEDLRKFGMIPEFLGRLPITVTLQSLTKELLVRILKEPRNAILKQYIKLLELDEVKLVFEDEALEWIAEQAMKKETGARALRSIIEEFMLDIMYEIPKDPDIGSVVITRA